MLLVTLLTLLLSGGISIMKIISHLRHRHKNHEIVELLEAIADHRDILNDESKAAIKEIVKKHKHKRRRHRHRRHREEK